MGTLNQKRGSFALRPLNTRNDRRLQSLRLCDNVCDRLLGAEGKAVKLETIFLAVLALNDFTNKACADSMIQSKPPAELVGERGLAGPSGAADENDWLNAAHGFSSKFVAAAILNWPALTNLTLLATSIAQSVARCRAEAV